MGAAVHLGVPTLPPKLALHYPSRHSVIAIDPGEWRVKSESEKSRAYRKVFSIEIFTIFHFHISGYFERNGLTHSGRAFPCINNSGASSKLTNVTVRAGSLLPAKMCRAGDRHVDRYILHFLPQCRATRRFTARCRLVLAFRNSGRRLAEGRPGYFSFHFCPSRAHRVLSSWEETHSLIRVR